MRSHFDEKLKEVSKQLVIMGALCEEAVSCAMKAFFEGDGEMAVKAEEKEKTIDKKEKEIESLCMGILLQEQPVASDLRKVSSALKMISDMERIGDQAEDIGEIVSHMESCRDHISALNPGPLEEMGKAALEMVTQSVNAFVEEDVDIAKGVIEKDDQVDEYFMEVRRALIDEMMAGEDREAAEDGQPKGVGETCLDIFMIAKYLERVADHATNIAEWVIYGLTGVRPD